MAGKTPLPVLLLFPQSPAASTSMAPSKSKLPGTGSGGLLLSAIPRVVIACTTILAMVSSAPITSTTVSTGTSSAVLGPPSAFPYRPPPEFLAAYPKENGEKTKDEAQGDVFGAT